MSQKSVSVSKLAKLLDLKVFTKELDIKKNKVTLSDVNRPALQLSGYFEYFEPNRVQIIGMVEYSFLKQMDPDKRIEIYNALLEREIPCIIFSRDFEPDEDFLRIAEEKDVPLLGTHRTTSSFMAELILCLSEELAPCVTIHGVLVDVYGEGLLITGESGIGKSEVALELIHRGHRLVSDDVVEIKKVSDATLIGTAPDITRHFIELRGIGIIDAKALFGVESVKNTQSIDLVIKLEEWDKEQDYDRMGLEEKYIEYLGNEVVCHSIPIRPGRNLAIICESAAVNFRQKKMGYNAAKELYNRVTARLPE